MTTQPEALTLAGWLDTSSYGPLDNRHKAAALLRTQQAEIERKDALLKQALEALHGVLDKYGEPINIMSISGGLYEVVQCNDAISAIKKEIAS